jgi:hypothetical protein
MWGEFIKGLGLDVKPIASVNVADCAVELRRQQSSNDVWIIATGPLGTWPALVLSGELITKHQEIGPLPVERATLRKGSVAMSIDDDFALHLRARRRRLQVRVIYKGFPNGGGDFGLPSGRGLKPWQRLTDFLRGRRGDGVMIYRHAPRYEQTDRQ